MPVETPSIFSQVIQDHLELKEKNSELNTELPLDRYKDDDPFENHPLFKTEEQARIEDTLDGTEPAIPAEPTIAALKWPGEGADEEPFSKVAEPQRVRTQRGAEAAARRRDARAQGRDRDLSRRRGPEGADQRQRGGRRRVPPR